MGMEFVRNFTKEKAATVNTLAIIAPFICALVNFTITACAVNKAELNNVAPTFGTANDE